MVGCMATEMIAMKMNEKVDHIKKQQWMKARIERLSGVLFFLRSDSINAHRSSSENASLGEISETRGLLRRLLSSCSSRGVLIEQWGLESRSQKISPFIHLRSSSGVRSYALDSGILTSFICK